MKRNFLYWLALCLIVAISCQKELSFEGNNIPAEGSLQADVSGDCLPKTVNGIYEAGKALVADTNTITVTIDVVTTGDYIITTDTVNGYFFRATGIFTTPGINTVKLRGNGTPFVAGTNNFVVSFDSTFCDIQIDVLPSGSAGPAVFTLVNGGTPANCASTVVNGTYTKDQAVTGLNSIDVTVNVTTIGSYTITATGGGLTFTKTGAFVTTGVQVVNIPASGTPTTLGANTITFAVPFASCSFSVDVVDSPSGPAVFTLVNGGTPANCASTVVNGTYTKDQAVTALNSIDISVNVTTIGSYTISATGGGLTFTKTGAFVTTGVQSLNIPASGTPTTVGANSITFAAPLASCNFSVNVVAPPVVPAVGTLSGAPGACTPKTVSGTYVVATALTASNKVQVEVNITTAGTYTISSNTVDGFSFSGTGTLAVGNNQLIDLAGTGTPTTAGPQVFTVTFGTSTCTFTVNVLPNDYFPRTTNSNWSYEYDNVATDSLFRVVIAATKVVPAGTFNTFMSNDGAPPPPALDSSGYYRRNGGDYFEWFDVGTFIGYDNPTWTEYILVKDNVAAGTIWKTPITGFPGTVSGTPINVRFSYKILNKDIPTTVVTSTGSVTYQNVIVVEEKLEVEVAAGIWQDATSTIDYYGKSYYARGIGLIKFEAYDAANTVTFQMELRRYQIY